jgi:hypothetical protein
MRVGVHIVTMPVQMVMDLSPPPDLPQDVHSHADEDKGDGKLHRLGNPLRYRDADRQNDNTSQQQCRRVPESPEKTDHRRVQEVLPLTDDRRDGRKMIGIKRMPEAKDETEAKKRERHGDQYTEFPDWKFFPLV